MKWNAYIVGCKPQGVEKNGWIEFMELERERLSFLNTCKKLFKQIQIRNPVGTASCEVRREDCKEEEGGVDQGRGSEKVFSGGWTGRWRFAEVYMQDEFYAEWVLGLDKIKMWKMKCSKFFPRRLPDLERVMKQEGEPEETVTITRVEMSETLVEEMACEEMRVIEEYKVGMQQRVRWNRNRERKDPGKISKSGLNFMTTVQDLAEERRE